MLFWLWIIASQIWTSAMPAWAWILIAGGLAMAAKE